MKVLGIDEAGRGPVIGPMVMCGYLVDESRIKKLEKLGVTDSKLLAAEKREELAPKIKKLAADYIVLKITAKEIDSLRTETNLNRIEIERMRHMIDMLRPDKVVIDSPEVNVSRFKQKVLASIKHNGFDLVAENFADKNHLEVGAASILAKVQRDAEISKLHEKYGFFGSGYSSDERTVAFLKDWIKVNKEFPDCVRKSWMTSITIKEEKEQTRLKKFVGG